MTTKEKTEWEGGSGTYMNGECDVPNCHNKPKYRNWEKDKCGFQGDDVCVASLCAEHKNYKKYNTTEEIIKTFNKQ